MAYLYELEGLYAQLQEMDLDDETFQDTLDSIDFQEDLESNIEYFAKMMKNQEAEEAMFKAEASKFKEKADRAKAKKERFKQYINQAMRLTNQKKVQAGLFTVSTRDSKAVQILDEKKIPLYLMTEKHTFTPNKTEIKKAIEKGVEVGGAQLIINQSVVIK